VLTLLGYDGADFYNVKVDSDNLLHATVSDSFGVAKRLQQDAFLRLIVAVHESVLPAGAATSANQALLLNKIKDQVFTYKSGLLQAVSELNAAAGENFLDIGGGVGGEMRVVKTLYAHNATSAVTKIRLGLITGVTRHWIATCEARGAGEGFYWQGEAFAPVGVKPTVQFLGCTAGDDLYVHATGYNMSV